MRKIIGAIVGSGVAVFAGANAMDDNTTRNDQGEIVEEGGLGVFAINVGDCLQLPGAGATQVASVEGVPCDDPHDAQVYAEFDLAGDAFPGQAAVDEQSGQGCLDRWQAAIGTVYEEDLVLDLTFFNPTPQGWGQGDREVLCMVVNLDGTRIEGDLLAG